MVYYRLKMTRKNLGYILKYAPNHPKANKKAGYKIAEHILIAEKVLGYYLPEGVEIHHHDEDRANNKHNNLVICENRAYHQLLHMRMRVVKWKGDPNINKICGDCDVLLLKTDFNLCNSKSDGLQQRCKNCQSKVNIKLYWTNKGVPQSHA